MTQPVAPTPAPKPAATPGGLGALGEYVGDLVDALLDKLHVPTKARATIVHCVAVFVAVFITQIVATHAISLNVATVWAVVVAAAAAGGSAVLHYLTGLLPGE